MWKTGGPEMATPKRVRTYRPKYSDTSLSPEWRINMANKKKKKMCIIELHRNSFSLYISTGSSFPLLKV